MDILIGDRLIKSQSVNGVWVAVSSYNGTNYAESDTSELVAVRDLLTKLIDLSDGVSTDPNPSPNAQAIVPVPTMPAVPTTAVTLKVPTDYSTIEAAFNAASPDTTILVESSYTGETDVTLNSKATTAQTPIVIRGENGLTHVPTNDATGSGFYVACPHVYLVDLDIDGQHQNDGSRLLNIQESDCFVLDCTIRDTKGHLIYTVAAAHNLHVQGCHIHTIDINQTTRDGIYIHAGTTNAKIIDNLIEDIGHVGINVRPSANHHLASHNIVRNCKSHGTQGGNCSWLHNRVYFEAGNAWTDDGYDSNCLYVSGEGELVCIGNTYGPSQNNCIYIDGSPGTGMGGDYTIAFNSLYYSDQDGSGTDGCLRLYDIDESITMHVYANCVQDSSNNLYLQGTTSGLTLNRDYNCFGGGGTVDGTLGDNSASSSETIFTDATNYNFKPNAPLPFSGLINGQPPEFYEPEYGNINTLVAGSYQTQ